MKYSFVIPTYNKKDPLKITLKALNNLSGYSQENYEVVVVDDGSPGEVFEFIKGVNRNYHLNYVYLERCEESCRARTRNYGIQVARGQYIVFIDDDIVVNSDYLEELDRYYRVSDNFVVNGLRLHCPSESINGTDIRELRRTACRDANTDVLEVRHMICNRLSYNLSAHKYPWLLTFTSNLAVPRKLLLEIEGFDENFKKWGGEDIELAYRLLKAGGKFVINNKIETFHQAHSVAPKGENNLPYLVEKCKEVFKDIEPDILFSLFNIELSFGDPDLLSTFRAYPGKLTGKCEVELWDEAELESLKKKISTLAKKKGNEIIVIDYCESTDLDIWIQMLDVKDAVVSYFPRSLRIGNQKILQLMKEVLFENANLSFR